MKILLIDIDSYIPNLALMKVSTYHKAKGDTVGLNYLQDPDKAYISVIFKKNRNKAVSCAYSLRLTYPEIEIDIGGPGYDLKKKLPTEIEEQQPDYSLYPDIDYSLGFTTRGCIRKCPFCVVPVKEGSLTRVRSIEEIHDKRHSQIKLLDNNILADKDNFRHIAEYCIKNNLKLDISQGLDARLLDEETAFLLSKIKPMKNFVFAFDSLKYKKQVLHAIELLKNAGIDIRHKVQFYVYCDKSVTGEYGFNSALTRCQILKDAGTNPYVMLNIDEEPTPDMKHLKRWANRKFIFWRTDFKDYSRSVKRIPDKTEVNPITLNDFLIEGKP